VFFSNDLSSARATFPPRRFALYISENFYEPGVIGNFEKKREGREEGKAAF
jgi:hypothetical protein